MDVGLLNGGVGVLMGEIDEVGELLVAWLTLRGGKFVEVGCACVVGKSCCRRP